MNRILIVTEGSSDSFVLKKAIEELCAEIADFFDFVDMKENYPFTETGSLYNFCMGLCRINVLNNIMVIFDNDTAGVEKYKQAALLRKPQSFLVTKLPDHPDFCNIQTVGPQGTTTEDINGKAVAIECFLGKRFVKGVFNIKNMISHSTSSITSQAICLNKIEWSLNRRN